MSNTKLKISNVIITVLLISFILLLIWFVNNIKSFDNVNSIKQRLIFDDISGVEINDYIRISGINIGIIEDINLLKGKAIITIKIPRNIILYENAKAIIKSKSLLGEKYIELFIGSSNYSILKKNSILFNNYPTIDINQVLQEIGILSTRFNLFIDNLEEIINKKNNYFSLYYNNIISLIKKNSARNFLKQKINLKYKNKLINFIIPHKINLQMNNNI